MWQMLTGFASSEKIRALGSGYKISSLDRNYKLINLENSNSHTWTTFINFLSITIRMVPYLI